MELMRFQRQKQWWRFPWQFLFMWICLAALVLLLAAAWVTGNLIDANAVMWFLWTAGGLILCLGLFMAVFAVLTLTAENVRSIRTNGERLENILDMLMRNRNLLSQISHNIALSDTAKEIANRQSDMIELREAVLYKLHQHDFDATYSMIDDMMRHQVYLDIATQLKRQADKYRDATEEGRIKQAVGYVESLFDQHLWDKAASQIKNLQNTYSDSELVFSLQNKLNEKKEARKKELLAAWDEAVRKEEVDKGLEILKELDMYLTPSEGLALQESASNIYKAKLHNLGVSFSIAVSESRWNDALSVGQEIIREFPNSRMAREIRSKLDILQQNSAKVGV